MQILFQYLKPYKWLVFLTLLLAGINTGFSLIDPIIFGRIIKVAFNYKTYADSQNLKGFINAVGWLLLASIGVAMVSRIAKAFQDYFFNVITQKFGARIFTDGLKHAMKLPYHEFEDQRSGETLSILQKVETDTEKFISNFINILFGVMVGTVFVTIYSFNIHPSLPLVYFGGIVLLTVITNFLSRRIKLIQKNIVAETTSLAGTTTESLRNIELIKSLGLTNQEVERLNKNTFKILGLELTKVKRVRSLSFVQGTFVNTLRQVILAILMWQIYKENMRPDQLVTMQFFSFFIFGPLQEVGNIILSYREAEASLNNFRHLMEKAPEPVPAHPIQVDNIQTLSFEDVGFKHKTAQQHAVKNISFTAAKGETIAFVGPSGAGKTTLVKLLAGLYRPQQGKILYNGINENEIDFDDLRRQIGFVTQDTQLFSGTIRENLLFVKPDATEAEVMAALEKASAQNLLARAEKGIDTMIGEGGLKLSGGEKQRLSIARSLLRQPNLLIFDEATSALDSLTEEAIT
ncbi:MAG TPA: ABC transporter ATP-binding protein, partial [Flavihumibacter sp.]|nr:ABC transporter ATP-binding protein [Flavihumibacter sp.]